jgi:hypothetical protein
MRDETKNVFISHVHEDDPDIQNLKDLLTKNGYQLRDSSIDSSKPNNAKDPDYIKSGILAPRINWASIVIVLISRNTHTSEWVDWEIEYGFKAGKRIIGVWSHGAQDSDLPKNLDLFGSAVVGWNGSSVVDAIEGKINNWYNPNGTERASRQIKTVQC